jgi:Fe(3+) dicitrate transport protein
MKPRHLRTLLLTACLFSLCLVNAAAQGSRAALAGRVLDEGGAAVSNAVVTLRRAGVGFEQSAETDAAGAYRFDALLPGEYLLTAKREGFSLASQPVSLAPGALSLDLKLTAGALTENIEVVSTQLIGTAEDLQRLPGSASVIDRQTLETSRVFNFGEALRKAPGVYVREEEGFGLRPSIGLRGLDPNRSAKVLLLEDGVPLGHAPYGDTDAYYHPPVERYDGIEILKGASQIAYGPMTIGGVINYVTPNPPENLRGSVLLVGGNLSYFNGHANVGFTAGRTGFLFDYMRKQGEGARENMRSGLHDVNLKTVTKITESQSLTFKGNYYGENSNVPYSGLTQAEYDANPRFNPFRNDFFYGDRWGGSLNYANALNGRAVFTTTLYASNFQRDFWRQSSNSNERPNSNCGGLVNLNTTCGNQGRLRNYYAWGVDPRLRVNHNLFGVRNETDFGFRAHFETQNRVQQNGATPTARGGVVVEDNQRRNQAYSGYVQHRFTLDKWTFTPGLRVERVNIERTNRLTSNSVPVFGRTDLTQLIPGFGLSYSPGSKLTVFAGAHRGFAPPRPADIINNATGGVIELDPELSWNYEVGVRSLPTRGVRLDAAFFRLDYENQIVPANLSGGVGSTLTSAGETLHQGFEFEGRVDAGTLLDSPHNFYARAAYTWIPTAEYRGVRFSNVVASTRITGNRLIYAPEHLLNANFGYSHPRGLDLLLEAVYTGEQFGDDLNTVAPSANGQRGLIPAYTVWNATANFRVSERGTTVFVTAKNLLNDTFIVDRRRGVMVGMPRLVQAGVKFRF